MISRRFARIAAPALLVLSTTACGGGSSATPEAFVSANLSPGSNGAQCNLGRSTPVLNIGVATGGGKPTVVADGQVQSGAQVVNVTCVVVPGGTSVLDAVLGGENSNAQSGSIDIRGKVDSSGGTSLHATFQNLGIGWNATDCTVSYTYGGTPIDTTGGPLNPGRIWGHVSCPQMTPDNGSVANINGMDLPVHCDGEADFLFENCSH